MSQTSAKQKVYINPDDYADQQDAYINSFKGIPADAFEVPKTPENAPAFSSQPGNTTNGDEKFKVIAAVLTVNLLIIAIAFVAFMAMK